MAGRKFAVRPAKALLIGNGRGEKPVRGTILIGNAPGGMMEIDRIGIGLDIGACGEGARGKPAAQPPPGVPS